MSMCKICLKGQDQHNKKLWSLHQTQICAFCSKGSSEHSWKLWQIHNLTVESARQGCKTVSNGTWICKNVYCETGKVRMHSHHMTKS